MNASLAASAARWWQFLIDSLSKMKIITFLISLLLFSSYINGETNSGKPNFTIFGHINNWNGKYIYFSCHGIGNDRIWDSVIVSINTFKFTGFLNEPANGFITTLTTGRVHNLKDSNLTQRLFIYRSLMKISLVLNKFQSAKLIGSKYQDDYLYLLKLKEPIDTIYNPISKSYEQLYDDYHKKLNQGVPQTALVNFINKLDSLGNILESISEKYTEVDKLFFKQNPNSYVTAYILQDYYGRISLSDLNDCYNRMSQKNKIQEYGIKLKGAISKLIKASPGSIASDFNSKDINGDSLILSQFKGKYILLDFWASWCKPCRAANPELITLYNKYKKKGIEFIGVADDNGNEDKWKLAIIKDSISIWRHILDKQIGEKYSVYTIPLQILINPQGIIIGRFGAGGEPNENLAIKMKLVFGE